MNSQYDFKKEWEKTKKQLIQISRQATEVAKRGEKELIKISQTGKIHFDSTANTLKKEKLFYSIGKEYVGLKDPGAPSKKLTNLLKELKDLEKKQTSLKNKLKPKKQAKKKTVTGDKG